jgi:hypothetical protein
MAGIFDVYRNYTRSVSDAPQDRIGHDHRAELYDTPGSPGPHDEHIQAEHGFAQTLHNPVAGYFVK